MSDTFRSFFSSHREASESVKRAEKFSLRLPIVGRVTVPPPEQLAFFGALGALAAVGVLEWPVAVAIGVGQVMVARQLTETRSADPSGYPEAASTQHALPPGATASAQPAKKAAAEKSPSEKAAKKTPTKKTAAKKTPAKKTAAKKTAATKTAARKTAAKKRTS